MSYDRFAKYVLVALEQLQTQYLASNPLTELLVPTGASATSDVLRRILLDAINSLNPSYAGPGSDIATRRYQHLILRYEHGATVDRVCASLGVSGRQARRDHHEAVEALAHCLWQQYRQLHPAVEDRSPEPEVRHDHPQPRSLAESLDLELDLVTPAIEPDVAPIQEIASSALATVAKLAAARWVTCRSQVSENLAPLHLNRAAARQALILMLAFAIETEGVTTVTISIQDDSGETSIVVESYVDPHRAVVPDIPAEDLGTDDRLRVSRRFAETLGGTFAVKAVGDSSFQLIVGIPPAPMTTILAVDDNPDMLRLMSRYLVGTPYRLLPATTSERALHLATTANPAVIVLDLMMPTQDGWEVLQEIQRRSPGHNIPVIVCSILRERALAISLGAVDFLGKPITRSALLTALNRLAGAALERRELL